MAKCPKNIDEISDLNSKERDLLKEFVGGYKEGAASFNKKDLKYYAGPILAPLTEEQESLYNSLKEKGFLNEIENRPMCYLLNIDNQDLSSLIFVPSH